MTNSRTHYHPLSIWLHWLTALLFVAVIGAIELRGFLPRTLPLRTLLFKLHIYGGQLIFLMLALRVAVRLYHGAPEPGGDNKALLLVAKLVHALLYLLPASMIFTGIAMVMAGGREVAFLGFDLPQWITPNKDLQFMPHQIHEWIGKTIIALVGLHVAAALWHQYFLKDDLLRRMHP